MPRSGRKGEMTLARSMRPSPRMRSERFSRIREWVRVGEWDEALDEAKVAAVLANEGKAMHQCRGGDLSIRDLESVAQPVAAKQCGGAVGDGLSDRRYPVSAQDTFQLPQFDAVPTTDEQLHFNNAADGRQTALLGCLDTRDRIAEPPADVDKDIRVEEGLRGRARIAIHVDGDSAPRQHYLSYLRGHSTYRRRAPVQGAE